MANYNNSHTILGELYIKQEQLTYVSFMVLPRSNDHVYICLFVNIEIKKIRLAYSAVRCSFGNYLILACITQLVELLVAENPFIFHYSQIRIPSMLSFHCLYFYCIIFLHESFKYYCKTVLTFIQSVHQMGHYQTPKRICEMP